MFSIKAHSQSNWQNFTVTNTKKFNTHFQFWIHLKQSLLRLKLHCLSLYLHWQWKQQTTKTKRKFFYSLFKIKKEETVQNKRKVTYLTPHEIKMHFFVKKMLKIRLVHLLVIKVVVKMLKIVRLKSLRIFL